MLRDFYHVLKVDKINGQENGKNVYLSWECEPSDCCLLIFFLWREKTNICSITATEKKIDIISAVVNIILTDVYEICFDL